MTSGYVHRTVDMINKDYLVTVRSCDGSSYMKVIICAYTPREAIDLGAELARSLGYMTGDTIHSVEAKELYDGMVVCGSNQDVRSFGDT